MVTRSIKYSLGILAVLLAVLLILPFFFDANDYKPQIIAAVEKQTGHKLQVGNIRASFFPWLGVRLEAVELSNRQGFSSEPLLKLRSMDVQVALASIFSEKIEIKRFVLDAPEFLIERNAKGEMNFSDLTKGGDASQAEGAGTVVGTDEAGRDVSPVMLTAEELVLSEGRLVWKDDMAKATIEVSNISLEVRDVQLDRPVQLAFSAQIAGAPVELSGQVGPLNDIANIDPQRLPAQLHMQLSSLKLSTFAPYTGPMPEFIGENAKLAMDMQAEQRPDGVRAAAGSVLLGGKQMLELEWKTDMPTADRVNVNNMSLKWNNTEMLQVNGKIQGLSTALSYEANMKSRDITRQELTSLVPELGPMYAAHPQPWTSVRLAGHVVGNMKQVDIRDLQLMLNGELVQTSGLIQFAGPDIRVRVAANDLHADPWLPQAEEQKAEELPVVQQELGVVAEQPEPDLRFLKSWKLASEVQVDKLHLRGLELKHLQAVVNGKNGRFNISPFRFGLAGGQVTEKASLLANYYPAKWTESVNVTGVQVGPVLKALAGIDMLEGVAQLETDMSATGLSSKKSVESLSGKGSFSLRDGKLRGIDIAGTLRNLRNLGARQGPKETDFSQMSGSFVMKNGVATNNDLLMASPLFRLTGRGVVDLVRQQMDYHVKPKVVGTLIGQGDNQPLRKGLIVPLHISGPFSSPKVKLEMDAKSLLENLGGIEGVLKKKPAGDAGESSPSLPQAPVKKALEGILKKL